MSGGPFYGDYQDYLKTPLFRAIRRVVINRAGGICETCSAAPVSEVHHKKYPAWGAYDAPANLIALCHDCHCRAHDKPKRGTNGANTSWK